LFENHPAIAGWEINFLAAQIPQRTCSVIDKKLLSSFSSYSEKYFGKGLQR
jgi:hypothetical protein